MTITFVILLFVRKILDTLENTTNEIHDNIMCLSSPRKNIIEQDNFFIDKKENSTIDHSPTCDEVILEEPILQCQENFVCISPKSSPPREDIMVQEKDNNSDVTSLDYGEKMILHCPLL